MNYYQIELFEWKTFVQMINYCNCNNCGQAFNLMKIIANDIRFTIY